LPEIFTNQENYMRIEMTRRAFIGTSAAALGGLLVPHAVPAAADSGFHICPKSRPPAPSAPFAPAT
jgi:hypothetical protein